MRVKREKIGDTAAVKGTMVVAHLEWARQRMPDLAKSIVPRLDAGQQALVTGTVLATEWVPLKALVALDRAIAAALGGDADGVWRDMGRHSACVNLAGVYKSYVAGEPHRFFEKQARLHERFQSFGRASYERTAERAGRIRLDDYTDYSPVYCASAVGFYQGALETMHVPGPIRVAESECTCAGDAACVFDLGW